MGARFDDKALYDAMENWTPIFRFSERAPEECPFFFMEGALLVGGPRDEHLLRVHFQTADEERYLVFTLDEARAMHEALTDCHAHLTTAIQGRILRHVET